MNYVHELNRAMHDNARFDAVVARLAADQSVLRCARSSAFFAGFVPGKGHRRRDLIQAITEHQHRTLDARQRARAANLDAHNKAW
jgi:hypothetical protein